MVCSRSSGVVLSALASLLLTLPLKAQEPAARQADEQAIRTAAKAYQAALAKGDAKAVADFWTADGDYVDAAGQVHPASELVAEVGKSADAAAPAETKIADTKIRLLTADVAVEEGVSGPDGARGHYHATWVKSGSRWRLASLCELAEPERDDARLADWGWMVGTWKATSDGQDYEVSTQWNATQTYLLRDIKATRDGQVMQRGSQRIGYDPLAQTIRSWSFDSDGGFGEAVWTRDGDAWVGQATGTLPDGRQSSGLTVITVDGPNRYTRKLTDMRVAGQPVPDQEIRFTRQPDSTK